MTLDELAVQRAAAAARLGLGPGRAAELAAELAPVVALLDSLGSGPPARDGGAVGVGAGGMPLRADVGPPYALARRAADLAAAGRAGYVLVGRLAAESGPRRRSSDARPRFHDALGEDQLAAELELGA